MKCEKRNRACKSKRPVEKRKKLDHSSQVDIIAAAERLYVEKLTFQSPRYLHCIASAYIAIIGDSTYKINYLRSHVVVGTDRRYFQWLWRQFRAFNGVFWRRPCACIEWTKNYSLQGHHPYMDMIMSQVYARLLRHKRVQIRRTSTSPAPPTTTAEGGPGFIEDRSHLYETKPSNRLQVADENIRERERGRALFAINRPLPRKITKRATPTR